MAAGWRGHFLSQSKEKEICTLRKEKKTKSSKRIQIQRFWLKLFLRISPVCLFSVLILTHLVPVCKNLSLSIPVGLFVLFWFVLFYCYYLSHPINSSKNALCIQTAVQMYVCCQCATADTALVGHLAACPEGSPPGSCQDSRHRAGNFLWGSGTCLSSPVSSSKGSGTYFMNCSTSQGESKTLEPTWNLWKNWKTFGGELELCPALLPAELSAKAWFSTRIHSPIVNVCAPWRCLQGVHWADSCFSCQHFGMTKEGMAPGGVWG